MSDLKDIWNDVPDDGLSDEQLMAYLEGRLSDEERHAVEARLSGEGMESDALEGLQALGAADAMAMKARLNSELHQNLRKKHRGRRGIADGRLTNYAVVILLLLAAICFAAIWLMKHFPK